MTGERAGDRRRSEDREQWPVEVAVAVEPGEQRGGTVDRDDQQRGADREAAATSINAANAVSRMCGSALANSRAPAKDPATPISPKTIP